MEQILTRLTNALTCREVVVIATQDANKQYVVTTTALKTSTNVPIMLRILTFAEITAALDQILREESMTLPRIAQ